MLCNLNPTYRNCSARSRTVKAVPSPGWLVTSIVPPWASTIALEMARPSPLRPAAGERVLRQVEVFAGDLFLAGVKAGQFEQRLGEAPHLLGGVQAGFDRFAVFAGAAFAREGCLGFGDDNGQRRAEFVGGIGGKLSL